MLIKSFDYEIPAAFADTGSPHVIINVNELDSSFKNKLNISEGLIDFPVHKIGREIRENPLFAPDGANVNFIEILDGELQASVSCSTPRS